MDIDSNLLIEKRIEYDDEYVIKVVNKMKEHFQKLSNVVYIDEIPDSGVCVVGDLHGNDEDLVKILKLHGLEEGNTYLFLGDYIDRGFYSLRILLILFHLILEGKVNINMLRGNHESKRCATFYGFEEEVDREFGSKKGGEVFNHIIDLFQYLPLACVIKKRIFCVHAGLSKNLVKVSDIDKVDRTGVDLFDDSDDYFEMEPVIKVDLLWSDPTNDIIEKDVKGFSKNEDRGVGYRFGADVTEKFLKDNDLELIIRSHEFLHEGVRYSHGNRILTIFSSGNYCYRYNRGRIAVVTEKKSGEEEEEGEEEKVEKKKKDIDFLSETLDVKVVDYDPESDDDDDDDGEEEKKKLDELLDTSFFEGRTTCGDD